MKLRRWKAAIKAAKKGLSKGLSKGQDDHNDENSTTNARQKLQDHLKQAEKEESEWQKETQSFSSLEESLFTARCDLDSEILTAYEAFFTNLNAIQVASSAGSMYLLEQAVATGAALDYPVAGVLDKKIQDAWETTLRLPEQQPCG
jgi:hypothetical protein